MTLDEIESLARGMGPVVTAAVAQATAPLLKRIDELERRLSEPPPPAGVDGVTVARMITEALAALPAPQPGKDADPDVVRSMVDAAVAALPKPQDGKSVSADDIAPLVDEAVRRAVGALPSPKDGVGLAGAVIDRAGSLVLTLTDGSLKDLGRVVGKDADADETWRLVSEAVATIPTPKDGADGFGFDDLSVDFDGERTATIRFTKGERVKDFPLVFPVVLDRGVFAEGRRYAKGDAVTWGGSLWIAREDTDAKPETGPEWRLGVKRGRDARQADGVRQ